MPFWLAKATAFVEFLLLSGVFWLAVTRLRKTRNGGVLFWVWLVVAVAVLLMMWTALYPATRLAVG